jgi:hypothetical protein
MKQLGVDPKLVADQLGHSLDVNPECLYEGFSGAEERRCRAVRGRARDVNGAQTEPRVKRVCVMLLIFLERETGLEPATSSLGI